MVDNWPNDRDIIFLFGVSFFASTLLTTKTLSLSYVTLKIIKETYQGEKNVIRGRRRCYTPLAVCITTNICFSAKTNETAKWKSKQMFSDKDDQLAFYAYLYGHVFVQKSQILSKDFKNWRNAKICLVFIK